MAGFVGLLRTNRNYRYTWLGQVVSEIGDHFNTISVFSLALASTGSGVVVSGVMIARAMPMVMAGPLAGVLLDRMDRKKIMLSSDLVRAVVALCFIFTVDAGRTWPLYALSALLMFCSPFFTSGRASILPTIASKEELHTANSLTQTTQWTTLTIGTLLGGTTVMQFGYKWAFVFNSLSFVFSALCIWRLRAPSFRAQRTALTENRVLRPWHEYREGLRYMRSVPLLFALGLVHIGWATGGGAAQILFTLFGEVVYPYGAAGMGTIWGCAGIGLLCGGAFAHWIGSRIGFEGYKRLIAVCYLIHGGAYVVFSQVQPFAWVLFFIGLSRAGVGVTSVLNFSQLLRHVPNEYRGRVFATIESMTWTTMMFSMAAAGLASATFSPRTIGLWSGVLSSSTAVIWICANWKGRIQEPPLLGVESQEIEVHGDPTI